MKQHTRTSILAFIAATLLVVGAASGHAADGTAAEGKVLVFATEFSAAVVFDNPQGCAGLPTLAHILVNQTNAPIKVFGGPGCNGPSLTAQPGWGGHVLPFGSLGGSFSP